MRALSCLFLAFVAAFGFSIEVDYGVEDSRRFAIITLKHAQKFPCKEHLDVNGEATLVECRVNAAPKKSFPRNRTEFFEIYSAVEGGAFVLYIKPREKQRLFAIFMDLKSAKPLPKERPAESRTWQIIGYKGEIPFLSNKKSYEGINFPISVPNANLPSIGELNIDSAPLSYDDGPDLNAFLAIKSAYEKKNYAEAIRLVDALLEESEESIFRRDSLLFRIRAMHFLGEEPDDAIALAKQWIKSYPADINAPEVLYIMGLSYSALRIYKEAKYYFDRILSEYEDSKYAQYALVGIAKNLAIEGDRKQPDVLFAQAYKSAKDLDTASFVAYHWARFELENAKKEGASDLFSRIINANPGYFLKDRAQSYRDFSHWAENGLFGIAARAGRFVAENSPKDDFREKLLFDVGAWFEQDSNIKDAHAANEAFLADFKDSPLADAVKKRDDNLMFSLNEGDLEKQIAQFDYIIATYPGSENAKIALAKKAAALLNLGRYEELLGLKSALGAGDGNIKAAYAALIAQSSDCKAILGLYLEADELFVTPNAAAVFDCLMEARIYAKAREISGAKLKENLGANELLSWLYNEANAAFLLRDFNGAAKASRDAFAMAKELKKHQDSGIILFMSLANLGRKEEAMRALADLERIFGGDSRMLKVYHQLFLWALQSGDKVALERYAKEVMALQKKFNTLEYSPAVEIAYADVLFEDGRLRQMLGVLGGVFGAQLNNEEAQKVRYMRGVAHLELGENEKARQEIAECLKISPDSPYGRLCSEADGQL